MNKEILIKNSKNRDVRILQRKCSILQKDRYFSDKVYKINKTMPHSYGIEDVGKDLTELHILNANYKLYELNDVPKDIIEIDVKINEFFVSLRFLSIIKNTTLT